MNTGKSFTRINKLVACNHSASFVFWLKVGALSVMVKLVFIVGILNERPVPAKPKSSQAPVKLFPREDNIEV